MQIYLDLKEREIVMVKCTLRGINTIRILGVAIQQ